MSSDKIPCRSERRTQNLVCNALVSIVSPIDETLRVSLVALIVHAARVVRAALIARGPPFIVGVQQRFFDLPVILLGPNRELEVFLCDRVPVLARGISSRSYTV